MLHVKRRRSLVVVLAAVAAAISVSSVALAAGGLSGTYTTTIKSPAQLKGRWVLTFAQGASYTVAVNGQAVARGKYTSTAKTVTLDREQGSGCTGAGTYAWKRSGKTMTFVRKRETSSCQARALVLGHRFTLVRS
jgi:hypothetical protein